MSDGTMYAKKLDLGETFIQQGEMFGKRFMEKQDRVMESWGMGNLAGVYANAVLLVSVKTGFSNTVILSDLHKYYVQINK